MTSSEDTQKTLKIAGSLDIEAAATVHGILREAFASPGEIRVDLSGVETCDAVGLQILISARKSAREAGRGWAVAAAAPIVAATAASLGLSWDEIR